MNIQYTVTSPSSDWPSSGRLTGSAPVLDAGDVTRLVLYVSMHDVATYKREGDDLLLVLENGQIIRLDDFFRNDANGRPTLALVGQRDEDGVIGSDEDERDHLVEVKFEEAWFGDSFQGSLTPTVSAASFASTGVGFAPAVLAGLALGGVGLAAVGRALGGKGGDNTAPDAPRDLSDYTNSDGTVTVKGKAEPNSTIKVKWPDGSTSEGAAGEDGTFELTSDKPQPKGDIEVSATDEAGNTGPEAKLAYDGGASDDRTAPDAPSNLEVSDNPDGTVKVTGQAEPGSKVKVTFPNGSTKEVTADKDGKFSATSDGPQSNGDIQVSAEDASGNTSAENTVSYEDGMPPAAPSNLTAAGNDDGTVTVSGDAEPGSTVKVTFPDGSTGEVTTGEDGKFSITSPKGTVQFNGDVTASATDINEITGPDAKVSYTDETAPLEPTDLSVEDHGDGTITVTGKAEPGSIVKVTFPDGSVVEGIAGEDGTFSVDSPEGAFMTEGWVKVQPKDVNGNLGPVGQVEYDDTIAPPPPQPDVFKSADDPASISGGGFVRKSFGEERADEGNIVTEEGNIFTNNREVEFSGKGGEPGGKVFAYVDGTLAGTFDVNPDGTWLARFNLPDQDGTYAVTFTQKDSGGNESVPSDPKEVTLDTVAPDTADVTLDDGSDSGTKGDWATTDDTPTLDFVVEDDAARVFVRVDGGAYQEVAIGEDGRVSYTLDGLQDGQHRVEYYTADRAGNTSELSGRDINIVPEFDAQLSNWIEWEKRPGVWRESRLWDDSGRQVPIHSMMRHSYKKGVEENMKFYFTDDSNKIVGANIYVDGVKVDSTIEIGDTIGEFGKVLHANFRFPAYRISSVRVELIDEFGHTVESRPLKFYADPLAIDLNGDGVIDTTSIENGVSFDIDGDGKKNVTSWVGKKDGFLVYDGNDNGRVDGASELFGPNPELGNGKIAENAFQNLAQYDSNGDGVIDAKDAAFDKIKVWQDKNQNGISDPNEVYSLKELGIKSIGVNPGELKYVDENGVYHDGRSLVEYEDGRSSSVEGLYMDSEQDNLAGVVLKYGKSANGESVMEVIKDGADIDMGGLQTKAMPDIDVLVTEGHGSNDIKLDVNAIKDLTHGDNQLRIDADASDRVEADGAVLKDTGVLIDGHYYNEYAFGDTTFLVSWETQVVV